MSRDEDRDEAQPGGAAKWSQDDDLFDDFDSEGGLDDPDRDSDFAAIYHEDEADEEPPYFDDPLDEPDEPYQAEEPDKSDEADEVAATEASTPWDVPDEPEPEDDDWYDEEDWADERDERGEDASVAALQEDDDTPDIWTGQPTMAAPLSASSALPPLGSLAANAAASREQEEDLAELLPVEDDDEDYDDYVDEEAGPTIPLGLIVAGVIALLLLGAGGYGVLQQRGELQEEVRQLQSRLATAASPADVARTRAENADLQTRNDALEARLDTLERENRTLQATVTGLEKQLSAQQEALGKAPTAQAVPAPKPATKPAPKPAPATSPPPAASTSATATPAATASATTATAAAAPVAAGDWFVNFGSYGQEDTARRWAARLRPEAGKVVVTTGEKDGRTFYRVRVVGLPSRAAADATARQLAQQYDLGKLWVGRSG